MSRVAQVWGFSFNVKKSNQIIFRRSTRNSPQLVMHLGEEDTPLKEVKEVKYLGVTFDRSLSFKSHINTVARRCAQRLGLFRSFSTPYVGPSCNQMMLLYRVLICPLLDYASPVWSRWVQNNSDLQPLIRIQRKALRMASGALDGTSLEALQVDCNQCPLPLRWMKMRCAWMGKVLASPTESLIKSAVLQAMPALAQSSRLEQRLTHGSLLGNYVLDMRRLLCRT